MKARTYGGSAATDGSATSAAPLDPVSTIGLHLFCVLPALCLYTNVRGDHDAEYVGRQIADHRERGTYMPYLPYFLSTEARTAKLRCVTRGSLLLVYEFQFDRRTPEPDAVRLRS